MMQPQRVSNLQFGISIAEQDLNVVCRYGGRQIDKIRLRRLKRLEKWLTQKLLRNHISLEWYYRLGEMILSEFAFFRFLGLNLLTQEEKENKSEVISVTEQVLDAEGIECDSKISKLSEEKINEILAQVRKRRRKFVQNENLEEKEEQQESAISA